MNKFLRAITILLSLISCSVLLYASNTIKININGVPVNFNSVQPQLVNNTTYVPVRGVFENMNYQIKWNQETKCATLSNGTTEIVVDTVMSTVTGSKEKILTNKILVLNNTTMMPLRELSELLEAEVLWDQNTKVIDIRTTSSTSVEENTSLLTPEEMEYLKNAYRISNSKKEQNNALQNIYLEEGAYTYADVRKGKNQEYASKYRELYTQLEEYEALEVPDPLKDLHQQILALRAEENEVTIDLILNGYSDNYQTKWDTYIEHRQKVSDTLNQLFSDKKVDVEKLFSIDTFSNIPLCY